MLPRLALLCLLSLLLPALAFAQDATPLDTADPLGLVHAMFVAVKSGDWWVVAALGLVFVVLGIRRFGQLIRDRLPDDHPLDRALTWLFTTRWGGWLLNGLTATAGAFLAAVMANEFPHDWPAMVALMLPVLKVGIGGAAFHTLGSDVAEAVRGPGVAPVPAPAPLPTTEGEAAKRLGGLPGGGGGVS